MPLRPLPGVAPDAGRTSALVPLAAAAARAPLFPRLARPAPAIAAPPAAESSPQPQAPAYGVPVTPQAVPPLDVAQLTEQVLARLDSRVVAERERRGRI